jgi:hypothetical protein
MATLKVGDVLQVRVACQFLTQTAYNVGHYKVTVVGGASVTDDTTASRFDVLFAPLYKAMLALQASYRGAGVQILGPDAPTVEVYDNVGVGPGTVGVEPLPPQIATLGRKHTLLAGPENRGYVYIPFPGDADSGVNGAPTAAAVTKATNLMNVWTQTQQMGDAVNFATLQPVIYHRQTFFTTPISSGSVRSVYSNQKRRSFIRKGDSPAFP